MFVIQMNQLHDIKDIETGAACALSSDGSGVPNANCMFYATQDSSLTSSLMALPYLSPNVNFCDDDESKIEFTRFTS